MNNSDPTHISIEKNSSPTKPVKSLSGAGDGIRFAARGAPWSVAVLTCHRHVIHYSSPSNPMQPHQHRKNSSPTKPVKSLSGAGDGIRFAARHAPWSVAVLTCHRHVIHYRSSSNPAQPHQHRKKLSTSKTGEEFIWSGRRDSNPRHSAWEADALPLNYSRIKVRI